MNNKLANTFTKMLSGVQPREYKVQATLTDVMNSGSGDASVSGRPGYVWALVGGAFMQIRAPDIMPVAGLPVTVTRSDVDGQYQSDGVNYGAIPDWDGSPYDNVHGDQHGIEGGDPIFVDQNQFLVGLLRQQDTADMTVIAGPVYYTYLSDTVLFPETDSADLTSYLPATDGFSLWVNVAISAATNTLIYTQGSEFTSSYATPEDYFPDIPTGAVVLGDVLLLSDTTEITQDLIDGRRRAFLQVGVGSANFTKRVVPTGTALIMPDTYCMIVTGYYTLQGTASITLQGDAELRII